MSGSGRESVTDFREALSDIREYSGGPPDVRKWLGGTLGYPGVDERLSRMSESGAEALPDVH